MSEGLVNVIMQIAVLEEQKNVVVEKAEFEPTTESDQLTASQTNVTPQMHGNLNMNEIFEDTEVKELNSPFLC